MYEPLPSSLSAEVRDLVRRMLAVEPSQRIAMDDLLRHAWTTRASAIAGLGGGGLEPPSLLEGARGGKGAGACAAGC